MQQHTVRRIVRTAAMVGLALMVASLVAGAFAWSGRDGGTVIRDVAAAAMVTTLALQLLVVVVQLLPTGRAQVPVFTAGDDGLSFIIVSTALAGALWPFLGKLAGPPMSDIMPGFVTPLVFAAMLIVGRQIQLRRQVSTQTPARLG